MMTTDAAVDFDAVMRCIGHRLVAFLDTPTLVHSIALLCRDYRDDAAMWHVRRCPQPAWAHGDEHCSCSGTRWER